MRESNSQLEQQAGERDKSARRQYLSLAFLLLTTSALLLVMMLGARAAGERDASSSNSNAAFSAGPRAFGREPQDYSKFSHTSPGDHAGFSNPANCANCHPRNGTAAQPTFPGHQACDGCHMAQFTSPSIPMCTICHVNDLGNPRPALKGFPGLGSFRVSFDHQQHVSAGANCAGCHKPARRGVALTIPASLSAHTQCYTCHSPGLSASNLSSCGVCHSIGGYNRTPATGRAFSFSFSHATHGPRQRLGCTDCHIVRAGLPQSRQVSSPAAFQHFPRSRAQSCLTCHNGKRAFGEADFGDCKKCHKGTTFRMGA
ncbi:MAG TPA: cytochrome c3 family protein [Pyrinomonadaceae bacterium]